jgi:NAD dependent epimerase/dehydratase family enzyme
LRAWENAALSAENGPTKVTVIRFGMICSPEGYPKRLVRLFKRAGGFLVGDGEQIVPIVDIDDAVAMMRWAADGQAGEGVINCVSPELPRFREVAETIATIVGKPIRGTVPNWLARPILGGSADYFLLSYDMRPARALAQGYAFHHDEPQVILRRALTPYMTG